MAVVTGCVHMPGGVAPAGLSLLTVVTWNTHDGRGDGRRLIDDLEAGRLTGARPAEFILLLQEFVDRGDDALFGARGRSLTLFNSPVRSPAGNAIVSSLALEEPRTVDLPRERQLRAAVAATVRVAG